MIHSATAVETENFDLLPAAPAPPRRRFPLPAEYYSTPPGDRRPIVAPWAPKGCGIASLVVLAIAFTGGYIASHGGAMALMNLFIDQARSDVAKMFTKDVTAQQKDTFDREMGALQKNLDARRVSLEALQPVLRDMREVVIDSSVTPDEANKLILDLQKVNREARLKQK